MIGRTHGVHAEPMTFGLKLALWYAEIDRDVERVRRARATVVSVGKLSGAVGTFAHLPPAIEADVCRAARPRAGAGRVAGDSARSPRGAAGGAGDHRRVAREVRARDPRPAEDRDRRGRGAVRARARRARRRCRTSATRSAASRSSAWRGCCAATAMAALENIALWHERDISHSSVERVILPDSFIALDHMLRRFTRIVRGHGRLSGADAREPRTLARRGVLGHGAARAGAGAASRASRPTSGCSATRCARSHEQRDFKALLLADPRRHRACCRRRRSSARSISTSSCSTSTHIFDRVFHAAQREGVIACARECSSRSSRRCSIRRARPSPTRCTRSATPASRTCGRASTSSSSSTRPSADAGAGARGRSRRQAARQSGDRELSHRGRDEACMKFAVVVFPGSNCDHDALSRREARARPGRRVHLAQGHRPEGRRRRHPARRLRARRLPAHRRDRALLADHGGGAGVRRRAAARCSASATASRSCSRPACCPGAMLRNRGLKFRCEHVHVRVEQTDTPFTARVRAPARCCGFRSRTAKATTSREPDVLARLEANRQVVFRYADAARRGRPTRRTRTARSNASPASATRRATSSA